MILPLASCLAVIPELFFNLRSAPFANKIATHSPLPEKVAARKGIDIKQKGVCYHARLCHHAQRLER